MAQQTKLDPAERGRLFAQTTRQNLQVVASKVGAENSVVSFELPKVRLLAGLKVRVEATVNAIHASSTSYTAHEDSPWKFLKRAEVSLNNGFSPFSITGQGLYLYNVATKGDKNVLDAQTSGRGIVVQGLTASPTTGTDNVVRFTADLPISLNKRDPIGYILLQNDETLCTVNITLGALADLCPAASGYTFAISNIKVSLLAETFSIPALPEAFPDISVLKLVNEKTETLIAGENIIKLPVGQTYRKIALIIYNSTVRVADSTITSNFDLMINQADVPYRVNPVDLASINAEEFGEELPTGMYIFDFSDQGMPNYGGARDYIDTERVTEFWIKFTSGAGTCKVIYETLSRLR